MSREFLPQFTDPQFPNDITFPPPSVLSPEAPSIVQTPRWGARLWKGRPPCRPRAGLRPAPTGQAIVGRAVRRIARRAVRHTHSFIHATFPRLATRRAGHASPTMTRCPSDTGSQPAPTWQTLHGEQAGISAPPSQRTRPPNAATITSQEGAVTREFGAYCRTGDE